MKENQQKPHHVIRHMQSRVKEEAELLPTKKSTVPESEQFSQGADTGKSVKHRTMLAFMNEL